MRAGQPFPGGRARQQHGGHVWRAVDRTCGGLHLVAGVVLPMPHTIASAVRVSLPQLMAVLSSPATACVAR